MIEFPFERMRSQRFGEILKPVIPVRLSGPARPVNVFMLVDSGADLSMLPYSVGETIGLALDMSTRSEVQGIGDGTVPYVLGDVDLEVGGINLHARVGWALIEEVPLLLGRLDIFSELAIEFREFDNRIQIRHRTEI
ncbi:MAG: retropepsin-like domain-containing protein [Deltaproteobacteria bacterium]|nr:retropepsin-like domain-containing protein [Deltaproteobacteria bacterium]